MAREIIVRIYCDRHLAQDEQIEAEETPPITIGSMKPRLIALCETCRKEIYDPLAEALAELGQKVETQLAKPPGVKTAAAPDIECNFPGCVGFGPYAHTGSLRSHISGHHKMTWREFQATYGSPETREVADQLPLDGTPVDFTCGIDGCTRTYDPVRYKRPNQALGVHRAKMHGVMSPKKKAEVES